MCVCGREGGAAVRDSSCGGRVAFPTDALSSHLDLWDHEQLPPPLPRASHFTRCSTMIFIPEYLGVIKRRTVFFFLAMICRWVSQEKDVY